MGNKTYTDSDGRYVLDSKNIKFSVLFPEGWEPIGSMDLPAMSCLSPDNDVSILAVVVALPYEAPRDNEDEFWKGYITDGLMESAFPKMVQNAKLIKKGWTIVNGKNTYYRIMSGKSYVKNMFNGKTVTRVFYITPENKYLAVFYYEALPKAYKKYKDNELKKMIESLNVEVRI